MVKINPSPGQALPFLDKAKTNASRPEAGSPAKGEDVVTISDEYKKKYIMDKLIARISGPSGK